MKRRNLAVALAAAILVVAGVLIAVFVLVALDLWPGQGCGTKLDDETLDRLALSMDQTVQMQPGQSREFALGTRECCYYFQAVDACATWSVEPAGLAAIDAETGLLAVDADAPSGSVLTVYADVENGRRVVSIDVHVYTPAANPLVGLWREEGQFACGTDEEVQPVEAIGELAFEADGRFSVTWAPFEIYHDYWGTYDYDLAQGTLQLTITGGNYIPEDVDPAGSFAIEDGSLVLHEMWLGSPHGASGPANCGHRF